MHITEHPEIKELIRGISRSTVTEIANEELPLFDELVDEYFNDPSYLEKVESGKEDPLSFGLSEELIGTTPIVTAVISAVVTYLVSNVIKAASEEWNEELMENIKAFFGKKEEKGKFLPLNVEQLKQVKKLARREARGYGMSKEDSDRLARCLVERLVLSKNKR